MTSAPASVAPYQPAAHGPVANAVKWAFKMYIRTRMAIDEVVAQANDELSAGSADVPRVEPAVVAGGSDAETVTPHTGAEPTAASEGTRVSWVTAGGIERHEAGELGDLLQREDGFVWVDIPSLDAEAERLLTDVFRFHPFAIRECREPGKVPKMHAYADHLFAVLHAPEPRPTGEVDHRELNQFIGLRYLVTVHERPESMSLGDDVLETNTVFGRIAAGRAHPRSPSELSYAIVTRLAARMEALVSELATSAAALDRRVIQSRSGAPEAIVDEMFELRHALLAVETMADQNRTVWARTSALTALHVPPEHRPLIEDLRDQFGRVRRLCQGQRELLQGALDFARTRSTAKMDRAMSRLALLSAVALPISIISSIYGMNLFVFNRTHIELLGLTLGAMVLLTLVMLRWARQQGWQ